MSPRPHPTLTLALAASLLGAAPAPFAAADDPEETGERCFAWGMTREEAEAGAVTEIVCYPEDEVPAQRFSSQVDLATVYHGAGATGTAVTLRHTSCTGATFNFTGTSMDNVISSTTLHTCGSAKHYTGVFSGSNQLISGSGNQNMNGTLNDQTTSIEYAP